MIKRKRLTIEEMLVCVTFSLLIVVMFLQVFARYALGKSIAWAEEISRFAFVWTVFLGIDLATRSDRHIRVTFQLKFLPPALRKATIILADLIWLAFNVVISVEAVKFVHTMFRFPYHSQTLKINLAYVYLIVPLGFVLFSIRVFQVITRRIKEKSDQVPPPSGDTELIR